MHELPNETILEICQYLDVISLFRFAQSCHKIKQICQLLVQRYHHLDLTEIPLIV